MVFLNNNPKEVIYNKGSCILKSKLNEEKKLKDKKIFNTIEENYYINFDIILDNKICILYYKYHSSKQVLLIKSLINENFYEISLNPIFFNIIFFRKK